MINYSAIAVMFTWDPTPEESHVFFLIAAMWGVSDAIWQTQVNGN